jgi:thioredoxin 1
MKFSLPLSLLFSSMKVLLLLSALTLLASCTTPATPTVPTAPAPAPAAPVEKMMKEEPMKKDAMMEKTEMVKDEMVKAMTGEMMKTDTMMEKSMTGDTMMKDDMMKKESMMKEESKMMKATGYMNYDEAKVKEALASGQKVALFFHASWCPSCKALDASINSSLSLIPQDALIVKVDYDTSTEMKKKYGVTSQHTTVLIDKDMNLVSKKTGARNVGEVLN